MKKLALLVVTLVFCLGTFFSTQASLADGRDCVRRCHEEAKQARQRCRNLPPPERERCVREVRERFEACVRACRH